LAFVFLMLSDPTAANKIGAETPLVPISSGVLGVGKIVRGEKAIISTRAVYALLASPDDDVLGIDGKVGTTATRVLARKGQQLFGVVASNGQITYCNVANKEVGALNGVFVNNRDKHTCFVDADRDGRFERSYDLRTKFIIWGPPIYYDAETQGNLLSKPVGYSAMDPAECEIDFRLELFVSRISSKGQKASIGYRLVLAGDKWANDFGTTPEQNIVSPRAISNFGEQIVVSALDNKSVKVKVERGFLPAPFITPRPDIRTIVMVF